MTNLAARAPSTRARRGWRRVWPARPHHQVALLIALYLVVGSSLAATVEPRLTELRRNTAQAEEIRSALEGFSAWADAQLALGSPIPYVAVRDAATRGQYLAGIGVAFAEAQTLRDAYRQVALGTSTERQLLDEFQQTYDNYSDIALALLTSPFDVTPEQVAQAEAAFGEQVDKLRAIRSYYEQALAGSAGTATENAASTQQWHRLGVSIAVVSLTLIAAVVIRSLRRRDQVNVARAERTDFESRLQRGLEMVHVEESAFGVVAKAIDTTIGRNSAELLVADSSRAHFHQVAAVDREKGWTGCSVAAPSECPATVRGQTQAFHSSNDLDACPYLADRPYGACSAVCVPLSIAGNTVGVIHTTGPDKRLPNVNQVATLEIVARKAGERVGMLRAFSKSQTQAHTDALTGLLNRRSLEDRVHELDQASMRYAVAYADLDHFKMLNDVHGHDTGDRALRLFARVLRDSVRPHDIPARYGGEEFVVVLPDCEIADAYSVTERIRERLAEALRGALVPPFTVSIGLSPHDPTITFSELVEQADHALLTAKRTGRNRTVIAGGDEDDGDGESECPDEETSGVEPLAVTPGDPEPGDR